MICHTAIQLGIIYAERKDIVADIGSQSNLLCHFVGRYRVFTYYNYKRLGTFNSGSDAGCPIGRCNIAGRNKAAQSPLLNIVTNSFRYMNIFTVIADENIVMHMLTFWFVIYYSAFAQLYPQAYRKGAAPVHSHLLPKTWKFSFQDLSSAVQARGNPC